MNLSDFTMVIFIGLVTINDIKYRESINVTLPILCRPWYSGCKYVSRKLNKENKSLVAPACLVGQVERICQYLWFYKAFYV